MTIDPVYVIQAAAMIFYAGRVTAMLRSHDDRIEKTETTTAELMRDVAYLKAKENNSHDQHPRND